MVKSFITFAPGVKLRQKTDEAPKTEILIADDTSNNNSSSNNNNKSNNSSIKNSNDEDDPILKLRQKLRQIQVLKTFLPSSPTLRTDKLTCFVKASHCSRV
jgi:hypothetical protein